MGGRLDSLRDFICNFIVSQYRELDGFGCCVESPVVEPDVCYTSTNLLAEYVLRNVCGRSDLADKIKAFLNRYPTDFYDYHQILLLRPFTLPFTTVEHVQVDTINSIRVVHVKRTTTVIEDYYDYANLLAIKAIYHIMYGERNLAIVELGRLNGLFDGYGFADAYYRTHNKYETYKVALAIIPHKLGYTSEVEKYTSVLQSINPFTSLYEKDFKGIGDLNIETASLTAMALYSTVWYDILPRTTPIITRDTTTPATMITIVIATMIAIAVITTSLKYISSVTKKTFGG